MKKWSDFTHEERIESFARYVKFELSKYIKENIKVWEDPKEEVIKRMPFNAITGRQYSGINSILLESEAKKRGFEGGAWISQQQAKQAGINLKKEEEKKAVKIAYIRKFDIQIKRDEQGKPITKPQLDKQGNPKINPETGEPFWKYVYERIKLDKPILETTYLYHSSQCENLKRITAPTLENNNIDTARPIISDKIGLFPQTKKDIVSHLKRTQDAFLRSQGVRIVRDKNNNGKLIAETLLIDGKLNGMQRTYHENGKLRSEVYCIDDKYHGIKKEYFDNGKLQSETHYNMDKKWIFKEYDQEGKVVQETDFRKFNKELKQHSHKEVIDEIVNKKNNILCTIDPYRRGEDLQSTEETTKKEFEKVMKKEGGYEFSLKILKEYNDLYETSISPKQKIEKMDEIYKKIKEFTKENKQERKMSPQVRAELEKQNGRGRGRGR